MSGSASPVAGVRVGKCGVTIDGSRDQHGFIARKDRLAESNLLAAVVDNTNVARCGLAIRFARERLLYVAVVVAI